MFWEFPKFCCSCLQVKNSQTTISIMWLMYCFAIYLLIKILLYFISVKRTKLHFSKTSFFLIHSSSITTLSWSGSWYIGGTYSRMLSARQEFTFWWDLFFLFILNLIGVLSIWVCYYVVCIGLFVAWRMRSPPGWGLGGKPWTAAEVHRSSPCVCCSWKEPLPGRNPSSKWWEHTTGHWIAFRQSCSFHLLYNKDTLIRSHPQLFLNAVLSVYPLKIYSHKAARNQSKGTQTEPILI